jgi:hypothetical protein
MGLKATAKVQVPPIASVAGELPGTHVLLVTANGSVLGIVMELIVNGAWLVLVSVTV